MLFITINYVVSLVSLELSSLNCRYYLNLKSNEFQQVIEMQMLPLVADSAQRCYSLAANRQFWRHVISARIDKNANASYAYNILMFAFLSIQD